MVSSEPHSAVLASAITGVATLLIAIYVPVGLISDKSDTVLVRVRNESRVAFLDVAIRFPEHTEWYGSTLSGEATEYRAVGRATRFPNVEAMTRGGFLKTPRPIDTFGDRYLGAGKYTYVLSIRADQLYVDLIRH